MAHNELGASRSLQHFSPRTMRTVFSPPIRSSRSLIRSPPQSFSPSARTSKRQKQGAPGPRVVNTSAAAIVEGPMLPITDATSGSRVDGAEDGMEEIACALLALQGPTSASSAHEDVFGPVAELQTSSQPVHEAEAGTSTSIVEAHAPAIEDQADTSTECVQPSVPTKHRENGNARPRHSTKAETALLAPDALLAVIRTKLAQPEFVAKCWQILIPYLAASGWDVLLCAGTGAGKSMIWIILALLLRHQHILVIAPLKAIQNEQVKKLLALGISAVAINSDTLSAAKDEKYVLRRILNCEVQVVFAAPESLVSNAAVAKAVCDSKWAKTLCAIIVDEAHVVYDWGLVAAPGKMSFRPEFAKLALLRSRFAASVPLIAVSATLCGPCLPAICRALTFGQKPLFALDVGKERDGCTYDVQYFRHAEKTFLDLVEIFPDDASSPNHLPKALIYVNSRTSAMRGVDALRAALPESLRSSVESFTAPHTASQKQFVMHGFRSGTIRVVFCTEALGMGIDLPDVDLVVQWQLPKDFKSLAQHFGRAARGSGARARAVLFCDSWIAKARDALKQPSRPSATKLLQRWSDDLDEHMRQWLGGDECLRRTLHELLAMDFSQIPGGKDLPVSTSPLSIDSKQPAPQPSSSNERRFWRTATLPSGTPPAPAEDGIMVPTCCSRCHESNAVPRQTIAVNHARAPSRLSAPPPSAETVELRRDLGQTLIIWRRRKHLQRPEQLTWQSERAVMSDSNICDLADRAPRLLAHVKHGNTIDRAYLDRLLGSSLSSTDAHVAELLMVLHRWTHTNAQTAIASKLTPHGWVRSKKAKPQQHLNDAAIT